MLLAFSKSLVLKRKLKIISLLYVIKCHELMLVQGFPKSLVCTERKGIQLVPLLCTNPG